MRYFIIQHLVSLIKLNTTQRKLILVIAFSKHETASSIVRARADAREICAATAWHNLRILRTRGLLEFGGHQEIRLTKTGTIIASFLEYEEE